MTACGVCGATLLNLGDRYTHTVEPIGHVATPSDGAARARARIMCELNAQLERALERGEAIDVDWVRSWVKWWGDESLLPTREEENAAYRKAIKDLGHTLPEPTA